ncbi:MAG: THUMP domain-containing protein [Thermoproteota archaeon]|nr:methyltransferase domain-containing protein [Candidatus Brockarchaeota archaeon]
MRFLLTFPVGIEDIVKEEIKEKIGLCIIEENPLNVPGKTIIQLPESEKNIVSSLRSVDSIVEYLGSFEINKDRNALNKICQEISNIEFPEDFRNASSFRVTCERKGEHDYTSMDVEKAIGKVLVDKYRLKVKLEDFEANVFVEIIDNSCFIGLLKEEYSRGRYFVFNHPAAIKPSIAYAMVRLADVKPGMTVLDPMCGGGTILIEAALALNNVKLYGFDISEYFLEGGVLNAEAMGLGDRIVFKRADCKKLSKLINFKIDRIVTNPPYGIKPLPKMDPCPLYFKCLTEMKKVLTEDGKIVIITLKPDCVKNIAHKVGLKIEHERTVKHNDTLPQIFLLSSSLS